MEVTGRYKFSLTRLVAVGQNIATSGVVTVMKSNSNFHQSKKIGLRATHTKFAQLQQDDIHFTQFYWMDIMEGLAWAHDQIYKAKL